MKAIIFGAGGQDGFYLQHLLSRQNIEAICVSRSGRKLRGDVSDWNFTEGLIRAHRPDFIFHLAANSTTRHEGLFENHAAISTGALNILEAAHRHSRHSRVFLPGSAMQFENHGHPIDETTPFAPLSPYAVSLIHSVYAARYYRSLSLPVYVGYLFNHDSPRRSAQHVNQKIALAAKNIASGNSASLEIGDPEVRKEFNFAGDVVEAIWLLVNQQSIFEAVIGSGKAHRIAEWVELCFRLVNKNWRDYVTIKAGFEPEYRILVSHPALIKSLGWQPQVDIELLARMMMEA
jgi:GDPmannose 4,6-dehydratase